MSGQKITHADLLRFLECCRCPFDRNETGLYTLGHACPDTDALLSSLFLALALDQDKCTDVRVSFLLPCGMTGIPAEIRQLLGEEVCSLLGQIPTPDDPTVADALREGRARLILVDQSSAPGFDRFVCGILDHHPGQLGKGIVLPSGAIRIESVGASASLVADVWRSLGLSLDETLCRIFAGAILADTEGLSPSKTRDADREAIKWLGFSDTCAYKPIWSSFLNALLSEKDTDRLIARDLREFRTDGGIPIGFAVLKCLAENMPSCERLRTALSELAAEKGWRLCLAKLASYLPGQNGAPARWDRDELLVAGPDPALCTACTAALLRRLPGALPESPDLLGLATPMSRKTLREPVIAAAAEVLP